MTLRIANDKCTKCGACAWECPVSAVVPGMNGPSIREDVCTECYGHYPDAQCHVACKFAAIEVVEEPIETLARRYEARAGGRLSTAVFAWRRASPR
jgi:ferredoxin